MSWDVMINEDWAFSTRRMADMVDGDTVYSICNDGFILDGSDQNSVV